ncbi:MAG: hypothetical protein ACXVZN_11455 [Gaiellaceae bacterium]
MKITAGTVSLSGLTLTGGVDDNDENMGPGATETTSLNGGGAIFNAGGDLSLTNVVLGGALRVRSGSVTGTGVTFANDYGEFGGAGVYIDGGSLSLVNSTLAGSAGLNAAAARSCSETTHNAWRARRSSSSSTPFAPARAKRCSRGSAPARVPAVRSWCTEQPT